MEHHDVTKGQNEHARSVSVHAMNGFLLQML